MFGFVYEWTNLINGKKYIGSHIGDLNDGYVGSGKLFLQAVKKYGIENFNRKILTSGEYETRQMLFEQEQYWIESCNAHADSTFYNISAVAGGGDTKAGWSEERKQIFRDRIAGVWANRSEEDKQQIVEKRFSTIAQDPNWWTRVSEKMRNTYSTMPPELLKERAQKSLKKYNTERRSICVKRGKSLISQEKRKESARLAAKNTTPEVRRQAVEKRKLKIQNWSVERRLERFEKASKAMKGKMVGSKNGRARAVYAAGVLYGTLKEAMTALSISEGTLHRRIKSDKFSDYFFASPAEPT